MKKGFKLGVLLVAFTAPLLAAAPVAAGGKITNSPSSLTVGAGAHQTIELKLTQPIICPSLPVGGVCEVSVTVSSDDPADITLSPTKAVWLTSEWAQSRFITLSTGNPSTYAPTKSITLQFTVDSDTTAPYYFGANFTMGVTLTNAIAPPYPVVADQSATTTSGLTATQNVLASATNNPDPATLTIQSPPLHGDATASLLGISYTPAAGYVGPDSLTYRVCSADFPTLCSSAVLSYSITAPPIRAPNTGLPQRHLADAVIGLALGASSLLVAGYAAWRRSKRLDFVSKL